MSFEFLRKYGAQRMRNYDPQPFLLDDGLMMTGDALGKEDLKIEMSPNEWEPRNVNTSVSEADLKTWQYSPRRFIDGSDKGRTVTTLRSPDGFPVPVYLSQIGAVELRNVNGTLLREYEIAERAVSLMIDLFSWKEIEGFAMALQARGFRLLPTPPPKEDGNVGYSFDFERMRKTTQNRSTTEMTRLEKKALSRACDIPTLVDGRLEPRAGAFDAGENFVVGLIKSHNKNYLHPHGWRVFYDLQQGERTPAFLLKEDSPEVISWYLRLDGASGEMPNWGIVRLEIPAKFFRTHLAGDWKHIDCLSRLICAYRCRDQNYNRSPVSIYPIQRAEESLGAVLLPTETFVQKFYRMVNI